MGGECSFHFTPWWGNMYPDTWLIMISGFSLVGLSFCWPFLEKLRRIILYLSDVVCSVLWISKYITHDIFQKNYVAYILMHVYIVLLFTKPILAALFAKRGEYSRNRKCCALLWFLATTVLPHTNFTFDLMGDTHAGRVCLTVCAISWSIWKASAEFTRRHQGLGVASLFFFVVQIVLAALPLVWLFGKSQLNKLAAMEFSCYFLSYFAIFSPWVHDWVADIHTAMLAAWKCEPSCDALQSLERSEFYKSFPQLLIQVAFDSPVYNTGVWNLIVTYNVVRMIGHLLYLAWMDATTPYLVALEGLRYGDVELGATH
eukprot:TRINITY_DN93701_c0_g1_i1.p1 TRINITY_DN93701_c0_g1~~TRINITY_DN93701_c0_g1_i1.p1  ORF type:complete len:315 (+),score=6.13 TRINITY_DN93701_c0_g1_i1:64-1008(+)